jgi:hypothetical protein
MGRYMAFCCALEGKGQWQMWPAEGSRAEDVQQGHDIVEAGGSRYMYIHSCVNGSRLGSFYGHRLGGT